MIMTLTAASAAAAAFLYWSNKGLKTTEYRYKNKRVPAAFNGYRIVQVSDLQSQYFGKGQRRLLARVKKARPDIIVFTGDLADRNHTDYEAAVAAAKGLSEIAPVYYINGNHELALPQEDISQMYDELRTMGIQVLFDRGTVIEKETERLYIAGLSEETLQESKLRGGAIDQSGDNSRRKITDTDIDSSYLRKAVQALTRERPSEGLFVLLVHEPQFLETYACDGVDLIFAGHAHGGQIRLPFTEGLFAPGQGVLPKLTSGVHSAKDLPAAGSSETVMVISRGLGNSTFPFRLFNRPEIVAVELITVAELEEN